MRLGMDRPESQVRRVCREVWVPHQEVADSARRAKQHPQALLPARVSLRDTSASSMPCRCADSARRNRLSSPPSGSARYDSALGTSSIVTPVTASMSATRRSARSGSATPARRSLSRGAEFSGCHASSLQCTGAHRPVRSQNAQVALQLEGRHLGAVSRSTPRACCAGRSRTRSRRGSRPRVPTSPSRATASASEEGKGS